MFGISTIIAYIIIFFAVYVQVFFLVTFFDEFERKKKPGLLRKKKKDRHPSLTVIVPCWNEESTVSATVRSLLNLRYPKDKLKIFIVDDGSTDKTWEVMRRFENNPQVRLFKKENGGKYTALNLGIKHAETELVGCLDADSFIEPSALKKIISYFIEGEAMAVIPAARVFRPRNLIELAQRVEYNLAIFIKQAFSLMGGLFVTPGTFSVYHKEVFEKIGGFREGHGGEDMEMAFRMQKNNLRIVQCHNAQVFTAVPSSIRSLYRQRLRWTYAYINNVLDYRGMIFNRKYGNFSWFTLPSGVVLHLSMLYFFGYLFYRIGVRVADAATQMQTVGLSGTLSFDWLHLNVGVLFFFSLITLGLLLCAVLLGNKLSEGKLNPHFNIVLMFLLYAIVAPIWLLKSIFNTAIAKRVRWR